ncbi:MAG: phage holin family protein [Frankiaceae bacterium]
MAHPAGRVHVVPGGGGTDPTSEQSLGELFATATKDLSTLVRMEKELARAELQQAVRGMVPVAAGAIIAAVVGLPAMLMLSTWAALGIGHWIGTMWGFLVMFGFWTLIGTIGGLVALRAVRKMNAKPERTIRTIKDTAEWARHPTLAPTTPVDELTTS